MIYRRTTALLVLAFSSVTASLAHAQEVTCLQSDTVPVQVCYDQGVGEHLVDPTLEMAEQAWTQILTMGFSEPWMEWDGADPTNGLLFYITYIGSGGGGMALPGSDIPSTPHSDCAGTFLIDSENTISYLPVLVPHYAGLAALWADDCVEMPKAFSGYIEYRMVEDLELASWSFYQDIVEMFTETFQDNPHLPLDYHTTMDRTLAMYRYGHPLFAQYLDTRWGDGDGSLIAEISAASRQDGTVQVSNYVASLADGENEPDYYDAIGTVLEADGVDFWDTVTEFAIWRALTGDFASGDYLGHAEDLPPVALEAELDWSELPISGFEPTNLPSETGTNYLAISLDDAAVDSTGDAVVLRIDSTTDNWHLAAATWDLEGEVSIEETRTDDGSATLAVDELVIGEDLLFAVTNLGDLVHDPDQQDFMPSDYTAEITVVRQPVVDTITPTTFVRGREGVALIIVGEHLNEDLTIDLGNGMTVGDLTFNGEGTEIGAIVGVSDEAELGLRDVTLTYAEGLFTTVSDAIEILEAEEIATDMPFPDDSSDGCTCGLAVDQDGLPASMAFWLMLVGLWALFRIRPTTTD